MSTDGQSEAEAALRQEIAEVLAAATAQTTTALMRVLARHQDPPLWTTPLVRDVASNVLQSLLDGGIPACRQRVEQALAAAGIEPGATR